jgi:hypothetical protein
MTKKPKLTRKQIAEGLEQMPIETILLGATRTKEKRLTASQIKFAEEIARGKTKAEAYRQSRPNGRQSKAKPKTASQRGQELSKDGAIQAQIEAFKVALEAQKYQTPLHLRALTIHKLTEKVLDPSCPPAQQIKAMELLGKITEVALFTERREVIQHNTSDQMKEKLLSSLRLAINSQSVTDVTAYDPDSLLAELTAKPISRDNNEQIMYDNDQLPLADDDQSEAEGVFNAESAEPTDPTPPKIQNSHRPLQHSIPHTQGPVTSDPLSQPIDSEEDSYVTPVTSRVNPNVTEGEGGINIPVDDLESELRTPPVNVSKS